MVNRHKGFVAAVREQSNTSAFVIAYYAHIDARGIHRPGIDLSEAVRPGEVCRIDERRFVIHSSNSGIVPPVVSMADCTAVVEEHVLLQHRGSRPQNELHSPLHSVYAVDASNPNGCAPVRILRRSEIHRRDPNPSVPERKIHLDARGYPGSSKSHRRLLDGRIETKHLL